MNLAGPTIRVHNFNEITIFKHDGSTKTKTDTKNKSQNNKIK